MPHGMKRQNSSSCVEPNKKARLEEELESSKLSERICEIFNKSMWEELDDSSKLSNDILDKFNKSLTSIASPTELFNSFVSCDVESSCDQLLGSDWLLDLNQLPSSSQVKMNNKPQDSDQLQTQNQPEASEQVSVKNGMTPSHFSLDFATNSNLLDTSSKKQPQVTADQTSDSNDSWLLQPTTTPLRPLEIYMTLLVS